MFVFDITNFLQNLEVHSLGNFLGGTEKDLRHEMS